MALPRDAVAYGTEVAKYVPKLQKIQTLLVKYVRGTRAQLNEVIALEDEWLGICNDLQQRDVAEGLIAACDVVSLLIYNTLSQKGAKQLSVTVLTDIISDAGARKQLWRVIVNLPVERQPQDDEQSGFDEVLEDVNGWLDGIMSIGKKLGSLGINVSGFTLSRAAVAHGDDLSDWEPDYDSLLPYSEPELVETEDYADWGFLYPSYEEPTDDPEIAYENYIACTFDGEIYMPNYELPEESEAEEESDYYDYSEYFEQEAALREENEEYDYSGYWDYEYDAAAQKAYESKDSSR